MTEYENGYLHGYGDAVSDRQARGRRRTPMPHGWISFACFLCLCACVWYATGVQP